MQYIIDHKVMILGMCLLFSEVSAAITHMIWPDNKGVSGVLVGVIKLFKALGAQEVLPPSA